MKEKIQNWFQAAINRVRFYLIATNQITSVDVLSEEQLRNTNDHGSKKRNR
jgi:hypothetical protein